MDIPTYLQFILPELPVNGVAFHPMTWMAAGEGPSTHAPFLTKLYSLQV